MNRMYVALVLFIIMYVFLLRVKSEKRWIVALVTAGVFVVTGLLPANTIVSYVNWNVLLMLAGTMGVVELFIESRMPSRMAEGLLRIVPNVKWAVIALSLFSGIISAFVDNIPYVATMLPILSGITATLGIEPYVLYFGLLTGATLGGNITPIGASANITAVGMLKAGGHDVSFGDFMKIGLPFTLVAVITGYLFTWFVWA